MMMSIEDPRVGGSDRMNDWSVGRRVALLRHAAGLTQAGLGRRARRSQNWVARTETGQRRLLFREAFLLADVLHVDVTLLDPRTPILVTGTDVRLATAGEGAHRGLIEDVGLDPVVPLAPMQRRSRKKWRSSRPDLLPGPDPIGGGWTARALLQPRTRTAHSLGYRMTWSGARRSG